MYVAVGSFIWPKVPWRAFTRAVWRSDLIGLAHPYERSPLRRYAHRANCPEGTFAHFTNAGVVGLDEPDACGP